MELVRDGVWEEMVRQAWRDYVNTVNRETTLQRKFETDIPRKGIARPQSQFPHSCVCQRIIYFHDRSACSAAGNMWTDPGNI